MGREAGPIPSPKEPTPVAAKRIRRAVLAMAILAAPLTVASASPASADAWIPRVPAGACIYGIPST